MSDSSHSGGETPPGSGSEPRLESPAAGTGSAPAPAPARKGGLRRPRGFEWILVGVAALIAWKLWDWRGSVTGPGKTTTAPITLVSADRDDLACAFGGTIAGKYRCEFDASAKPWPNPPAPGERLAPYFTTERQLYLIPGLFEQSALQKRYAADTGSHLQRDQQKRFVARCELRLVEKVEKVKTRWLRGGDFNDADNAWVAEPKSCTVE
ncbi:MAG TPA: hypothetical protein VIU64_11445 [Polyangia bacterium]